MKAIADMSSRAEKLREYKARQRERERQQGARIITIRLSADEPEWFARMRHEQRGPLEDFPRRALMQGACFAVNAGRPSGTKVRRPQ